MRAPVSIVIPTLDSAPPLRATLVALMEGVEAGLVRELVLSDGGSQDDTRALAEAVGAVWIAGAPGWEAQAARGIDAAKGDWVLLLVPEAVPGPGWVEAVERGIARGVPGHFALRYLGRRFATLGARLRAPGPAHGRLAPRAAFHEGRARRLDATVEIAAD